MCWVCVWWMVRPLRRVASDDNLHDMELNRSVVSAALNVGSMVQSMVDEAAVEAAVIDAG